MRPEDTVQLAAAQAIVRWLSNQLIKVNAARHDTGRHVSLPVVGATKWTPSAFGTAQNRTAPMKSSTPWDTRVAQAERVPLTVCGDGSRMSLNSGINFSALSREELRRGV